MAVSLAGRKVKQMQCHVGFGHTSRTGSNAEVDKTYMELTPVGVYVKDAKGKCYVVSHSNVLWCEIESEKEKE